tara:strand:+ start:232 stop:510 length:279 start_codon:yes stop_codon:yes gene_type:complete
MKVKKDEYVAISKAIYKHYNINKDDLYIDPDRIAIIRNYISDSPSWVGDVAFIIFGDIEFNLILLKTNNVWKPYKDINENTLIVIDYNNNKQ